MAQVKTNNFTKGISGKVGKDMLFKTWNGKTFVYKMPNKPIKESALQKQTRTKFKMATAYAKAMMLDPVLKEKYRKMAKKHKLPNAYTAAITEYMRKKDAAVGHQQSGDSKVATSSSELLAKLPELSEERREQEKNLAVLSRLVLGDVYDIKNSRIISLQKQSLPPEQFPVFHLKEQLLAHVGVHTHISG